jgi:[CysO sulfur-carrier protein]-S-L-cysteine hydrolase
MTRPRSHPGPARAILPAAIRDAILAHARAEHPNEACGLIAGTVPAADGGVATAWHPTRNRAASPLRYEIDPDDLLRVSLAIDDAGEVIWGIVHSHVRSPARPSATDIERAFYPDALYLVVSLGDAGAGRGSEIATDAPGGAGSEAAAGAWSDAAAGAGSGLVAGTASIRAWRIVGGEAHEVALEIGEGGLGVDLPADELVE